MRRRRGKTIRYDMRQRRRRAIPLDRALWTALALVLSLLIAWSVFKSVVNR